MKLLNCIQCNDTFNLTNSNRKCSCLNSGGKLIDKIKVEYYGPARIIHINDDDYEKAKPSYDKSYQWHVMMDGAYVNRVDRCCDTNLMSRLWYRPGQE